MALDYSIVWNPGHRVWLHRWTEGYFAYEIASRWIVLSGDELKKHWYNAKFDLQQSKNPHWGHYEPTGEKMLDNHYTVKDSGERMKFDSGMVRDTSAGKIDYWRGFVGPMFKRLCVHVTKGAVKYPDVTPGVPNWTLASGEQELQRYRESAARHFIQWLDGDQDEDHAAAVLFNINGAEYVKDKVEDAKVNAALLPKHPHIQTCTVRAR